MVVGNYFINIVNGGSTSETGLSHGVPGPCFAQSLLPYTLIVCHVRGWLEIFNVFPYSRSSYGTSRAQSGGYAVEK